jgi:hypothetical protein
MDLESLRKRFVGKLYAEPGKAIPDNLKHLEVSLRFLL